MKIFLAIVAALHAGFMFAELYPWPNPLLLKRVSEKRLPGESFTGTQLKLVATIVHNAGIYNGIVAGGLLWAACGGASLDVARVMLIGAVVAGVFGAVTISRATAIQAVFGIIGLILLPVRT